MLIELDTSVLLLSQSSCSLFPRVFTASGCHGLQGQALQCAKEVRLRDHEVQAVLGNLPPQLRPDQSSIVYAKWFHKRWLVAQSQGNPSHMSSRLPHFRVYGFVYTYVVVSLFTQPEGELYQMRHL